ncbi:MAG: sialidase family protein [Luteolibacter sp.]|uniref:sialidase family protein n=1 Tax=Luteolibacter sp. TaxID=1962973 RepID=UPI003264E951
MRDCGFLKLIGNCLGLWFAVVGIGMALEIPPVGPPADPYVQIPGTVVGRSPNPATIYLGSPSIAILPDGSYVACNDNFGGGAAVKIQVYRSTDRGITWTARTEFPGYWSNLFVHNGVLYLTGTSDSYGNLVIRKSTDAGLTWTNPTSATTGILRSGQYHTAPMPVIIYNGRIWRAFEDIAAGNGWPRHFRAFLMSAPVGADLLNAASWTFTASVASSNTWLNSQFNGWLEGNVVLTPDNRLVDILRADTKAGTPGKAAIIDFGTTGAAGTFDPAGTPATDPADLSGFIDFPGGATKFSIRRDPVTNEYWALTNPVLPAWAASVPGDIRNTLALMHSTDLRTWDTRAYLLFHPDVAKHAFQYLDWQFDGDDIIAASRTSWDGNSYHNANLMTFHRFANFRTLTPADSVPTGDVKWKYPGIEATGTSFAPGLLEDGNVAYSNRTYIWGEVPSGFANALMTRTGGGVNPILNLKATAPVRAYLAASIIAPVPDLTGWTATGQSFYYSDTGKTRMYIYQRDFQSGEQVAVSQTNWNSTLLLSPPAPGPVAWWRCESNYEGTAVADHLYNSHGVPSTPPPVPVANGPSGNALAFTLGQNVNLGDVFPLTRVPFTIAFWMKLGTGDTTYRIPLSKLSTGSYSGYVFTVNSPGLSGKASFVASSAADQLVSTSAVNDGLWHHLAVTLVPGQNMILYIDGAEQARRTAPVILDTTASLRFGAQTASSAADPRFQGSLDEIQIHHTALGAAEIASMVLDPDRVPAAGEPLTAGMRTEASNDDYGVTWRAIPGRSYRVYRSMSLSNDWQLQGTVTTAGQTGEYLEASPPDHAFYQVSLVR